MNIQLRWPTVICGRVIQKGGRTVLQVFSRGNISAHTYRDDIMDAYVCSYDDPISDSFVLQDDNARPHKACIVDGYLERDAIYRIQ
ncbi:hypothetical protein TNCV_1969231 [Trichonephila clavipes]|nr:hypothetical protein TNCV_1969231 [Trichonephila clavipes]